MQIRVLIVDDEVDFCHLIKTHLHRKGYSVFTAHTLSDGFDCLVDVKPQILFLDNNLPDGSGWDAVWKIVENFPQLIVYLISAHRNHFNLKEKNRNIFILEKPLSLATLDAIFNNLRPA